jgi:hypothetical protein
LGAGADDPLHGPTIQRVISLDRGNEWGSRKQGGKKANGGSTVSGVEKLLGLLKPLPSCTLDFDLIFGLPDPQAEFFETAKCRLTVLAL